MLDAWLQSFSPILWQTMNEISVFFPRLLAALAILLFGAAFARGIRRVVVKLLETLRVSSLVEQTPIEHFLKNADLTHKIEEVTGSVVYWLVMLVVLQTTTAVLGLQPLTEIFDRIIGYIPHVISAILILFFGILIAGVVESLVKGSIKTIDGKSARVLGKVSSYLVMTLAVMAAISELGIASEFIMVLFIGFVGALSLAAGLAFGLGGRDVVATVLDKWYKNTLKELRQ